jgi:hypothetical protein
MMLTSGVTPREGGLVPALLGAVGVALAVGEMVNVTPVSVVDADSVEVGAADSVVIESVSVEGSVAESVGSGP